MPRHTVSIQHFYVHTPRKPKERKDVANFDGNGADLLKLFHAFVTGLPENELVDSENERYVSIQEVLPAGRTVFVLAESGYTGIGGRIKNAKTHEVEHEHDAGSAHTTDSRMVFCVPKGSTGGLLFVEKLGNANAASTLVSLFIKSLKAKYDKFNFKAEWLVEADAWLENAELDRLSGVVNGYEWSSDIADAGAPKEHGSLEVQLVPQDGLTHLPKKVWTAVKGNSQLAGQILGFPDRELTDVTVTVTSDGKTKTFAVDNEKKPTLSLVLAERKAKTPSDEEFLKFCFGEASTMLPKVGGDWKVKYQTEAWSTDMFDANLELPTDEE